MLHFIIILDQTYQEGAGHSFSLQIYPDPPQILHLPGMFK